MDHSFGGKRTFPALIASVVALLLIALPAAADTVTNDIFSATSQQSSAVLEADGGGIVRYWVEATRDGSETSSVCNATPGSPMTLVITPPAPTPPGNPAPVLTASSSPIFTDCGSAAGQPVTYTASLGGRFVFAASNFTPTDPDQGGYNRANLADTLFMYDLESYRPGTQGDVATFCNSIGVAPGTSGYPAEGIVGPSPVNLFDAGDLVCSRIYAYPESLGAVTFRFTAPDGAPVTSITPIDTVLTDNRTSVRDFQPAECGTWNVQARNTGGSLLDTDTFVVTGCDVPPELTVPADMTLDTNDPSGAIATFSVSATDVADAKLGIPLAPTCSPASGSTFPVGTTEVTCSVTDSHGNTTADTFDVTVNLYQAAFEAPIDTPSVVNVAKVGRVIPIKAAVSMNGSAVMTGPVTLEIRSWAGCGTGAVDGIETFAPAGSSNEGNAFRWVDGRWMYNLDTSGLTAGCYQGQVLTGEHLAGWFLIRLAR